MVSRLYKTRNRGGGYREREREKRIEEGEKNKSGSAPGGIEPARWGRHLGGAGPYRLLSDVNHLTGHSTL